MNFDRVNIALIFQVDFQILFKCIKLEETILIYCNLNAILKRIRRSFGQSCILNYCKIGV